MKKTVRRDPKVTLCRMCGGTGHISSSGEHPSVCPQCEGSGRVTVSGIMHLDIRAYKPKETT